MHHFYFNFFLIFLFLIFTIILGNLIANKFKLLDYPSSRKQHAYPVPLIGGVYFYFSICFALLLFDFSETLNSIIVYSSVILFMGLLDDLYDLKVQLRFIIIIFGSYLLIDKGLNITYLGNYIGDYQIYLGSFSFIFTIICVVGLINCFNFLDGSDGMLLSQSIASFLLLIIYSYLSNVGKIDLIFILVFIFIFTIMILFNLGLFNKNKFFLGDSGSMSIGFIISFILIYYSQKNNIFIHPSLVIWVVALPLFDFFALVSRRILDNKSPFMADRRHIHHLLMFVFKKNHYVLIFTFLLSFYFGLFGFFIIKNTGPFFGLISFLINLFIYTYVTYKIEKKCFN